MLHFLNKGFACPSGCSGSFKLTNFAGFSTLKDNHPKKTWMAKSYDIPNNKFLLNEFTDEKFIEDFLVSLRKDINYVLLFLVISDEHEIKIAPNKAIVDINYLTPKEYLMELVQNNVADIVEEYQFTGIFKIIFRYREEVIPSPVKFIKPSKELKKTSLNISRKENMNFKDLYVPFSFNEKDFGSFQTQYENTKEFLYHNKYLIKRTYSPIKDNDAYDIKVYFLDNIIYQCFDERIAKGVFKRTVNNQELTIKNHQVIKYEKTFDKLDSIKPVNYDLKPLDMGKFFTYDIEAYLDEENKFVPYAVEWYTQNNTKQYYLEDYIDYQSMIIASFRDLLIKENHNVTVYIHNNKNFDGIYILNSLLRTEDIKIKPFFNKGKMISITLTLNSGIKNKSITITLKDSLSLLPSSLRKLGKSYGVETLKGIFPYNFVNKNNFSNYIGPTPDLKFYKYIDLVEFKYDELVNNYKNNKELFDFNLIKENKKEYVNFEELIQFKAKTIPNIQFFDSDKLALLAHNSFMKSNWDLKAETLTYLHDDCKSLYEILLKVRQIIFKDYHVDITTVVSNASLSFKIYLANFFSQVPKEMKDNYANYSYKEWLKIQKDFTPKIVKFKRNEYNFLAQSYYGGLVDVFKPRVENGYYYDINGHYANQMKNQYYPVGDPTYSTDKNLDNYFGVVKAKVTVPKMDLPPLPKRTKYGVKNVYGTWEGIYTSVELIDYRDRYGLIIEVDYGYTFKKKVKLFENFITHFNEIKEKFKGTAIGNIAKLTQNSLYGKWGMILLTFTTMLMSQHQHDKHRKYFKSITAKELEGNMELVTFQNLPILFDSEDEDSVIEKNLNKFLNSEKKDESLNVNVVISSFISAYARIEYNRIRNLPGIGLIAGDTDSVITQNPLPPEEVGPELGKLKLEYKIKEGIHVSSKFYYHLDTDGLEHIKAKGAGSDISKEKFEELIDLKSITYNKEKWYRNLVDGYVEKRDVELNIKGGSLKRKLILKNGIWIDTEPLNIKELPDKNELVIEEKNNSAPLGIGC